MSAPKVVPVNENCANCFFSATLMFNFPLSGMRGGGRQDMEMMVCARSSPDKPADNVTLEARWAQVRPEYWCGEWSSNGALVVR